MNFINTGLDDRILKSIDVENPSEDLVKAMNKQGLVQKEVQVTGKNGKTFTRKQWVKASDVKSNSSSSSLSGSPVDISKFSFKNYRNPDGQNRHGYETYRDSLQSVAKETEKAANTVLSNYGGSMKPYDQLRTEFENINGHSSYRDMIEPSSEQGLKDAKAAIVSRQKELLESVKDYTKWDSSQRKWVKAGNASTAKASQSITTDFSSEKSRDEFSKKLNEVYELIGNASVSSAMGRPALPSRGSHLPANAVKDLKKEFNNMKKQAKDAGYTIDFNKKCKLVPVSTKEQTSDSDKDTVKFDKTKSGKVGGIQIGKELATVIKTVPTGAKKLREVTDKDSGKTYSIYTDTSSNKPDGIVAVENQTTSKSDKNNDTLKPWHDKVAKGDFTDEQKKELDYGVSQKHMCVLEKDGKIKTAKDWDEADYAVSNGWKNLGSLTDIVNNGRMPLSDSNKKDSQKQRPSTGQKLSKEDAKKKTQSYTSKIGKTDSERNAFMDKVRTQGITWKEKSDNGTEVSVGINWMRCCMAMNKHFANGGDFNEK